MSGGVDSTVSALLLQQEGYQVVGVSFWFITAHHAQCQQAAESANRLGITHHIVDVRERFEKEIVQYFEQEYLDGRTPFPCAKCNRDLKWQLLFEIANKENCHWVAMGHYVQLIKEGAYTFVKEGEDKEKDQSFFLWGLRQEQLQRIIFPLGKWHKKEVKDLAMQQEGLHAIATKKESIGVCFCPHSYQTFLQERWEKRGLGIEKGNFVDTKGDVLGTHNGYPYYTVGQRRGLGLQLNKAIFVKEIRKATNEVVVAPMEELYQTDFEVMDYQLVSPTLFSTSAFDTIVRIRYRKQRTYCQVTVVDKDRLKVRLSEPLEAIAPGQTAVFYREGKLLGGGFIV